MTARVTAPTFAVFERFVVSKQAKAARIPLVSSNGNIYKGTCLPKAQLGLTHPP
jgi:hypothetical protein